MEIVQPDLPITVSHYMDSCFSHKMQSEKRNKELEEELKLYKSKLKEANVKLGIEEALDES